jgi:hypothetical protein
LNEDDKLLNDQSEISNVFNNFFVNVAKDRGKDSTPINDCHPSKEYYSFCELALLALSSVCLERYKY